MQPVNATTTATMPLDHWPVFGHGSPQRVARTPAVPGEAPPADSVDQEFEEYFFE